MRGVWPFVCETKGNLRMCSVTSLCARAQRAEPSLAAFILLRPQAMPSYHPVCTFMYAVLRILPIITLGLGARLYQSFLIARHHLREKIIHFNSFFC